MTEPASTHVSAPPASPVDVSLQTPSFRWTRLFTWAVTAAVLALWWHAIGKGSANVWPYCVVICLVTFTYVAGARATDWIQLVQSSGIIRAAQAASTAISTAADGVGALADRVLPHSAPIVTGGPAAGPIVTGGRHDLAS